MAHMLCLEFRTSTIDTRVRELFIRKQILEMGCRGALSAQPRRTKSRPGNVLKT